MTTKVSATNESPLLTSKRMLAVAAMVFAGAVVYGLSCVDGFWANLLAEIAGVALGVIVAVIVVEAILDRRRDEQWAFVRDQLAASARGLAQHAALNLHLGLPREARGRIPSPIVTAAGEHAATLEGLATGYDSYIQAHNDSDLVDPTGLHDSMSPVVWRIRSELGPRVLATSEPALVHAYGRLDQALGDWDLSRYQFEGDTAMLRTMFGNAA